MTSAAIRFLRYIENLPVEVAVFGKPVHGVEIGSKRCLNWGILRLLGQLDLDGTRLDDLRGVKQRLLLAYLLLNAGHVVATDQLVDAVWGDHPPATANAVVHSYVRRIRAALSDSDAELVTRTPGYVLELGKEELDTVVFAKLAMDGKAALDTHDTERAVQLLDEALSLWRGEPLEGLPPEGFVTEERARLGRIRTQAVLDRAEAALALGASEALVSELEHTIREEPYQERPRRLLMLVLYRAGRQVDALDLYRETRSRFVDELGLEPSRELQELEQAILRHDASLDAPLLAAAGRRASARRRRRWLIATASGAVVATAAAVWLSVGGSTPTPARHRMAHILAAFHLAQPSCCGFGFNAVWGAGHHDRLLRKIDPRTNRVIARTGGIGFQSGIPRPAAGAVWIPSASGDLIRFDPATGRVAARIPVQGPSAAFGYLTMWVTTTDHHLDRVDIATNRVVRSIRLASGYNNWVDELAIGEGAVWVAVADQATLERIDPGQNRIVAKITGFGHTDSGMPIAIDENAVWVLRFVGGTETLFRVDPAKNAIIATIPVGRPNGAAPSGTVATGDGYVWTGNWDATLSKVDPRTDRVVATLTVPAPPQNLTFGEGSLWVDSYDASRVWRVDPNS